MDVAAGAVGFASLGIQLLQGCIQGFILLSTAQSFGKHADLIRCEIEFEQYRLFRWVDMVGLEGSSPNRNLNWELINGILKQLSGLMNETSKFKKEYRLELVTTDEVLSSNHFIEPKKGLWGSLARVKKPRFYNETANSLQHSTNIWKRMKWAAIDKDGIAMLLSDIRHFIDSLYELLVYEDQKFIRSALEALLRHAVSQATDTSELSNIEQLLRPEHGSQTKFQDSAVKTALGLKQKSLMLGFVGGSPHSSAASSSTTLVVRQDSNLSYVSSQGTSPRPRKGTSIRGASLRGPLVYKLLERARSLDNQTKEMATYDDRPVLVEWKSVNRGLESKLRSRIKNLASLLHDIDTTTFHSLRCLGYLKEPTTGNYGYIFQLPLASTSMVSFSSLTHIFISGVMAPSLDDRMALATRLTETILQLHTSGWLHKGVRSENVLFFHQESQSIEIKEAYLEGYEYARSDNPSDMTESPESQQESNLYRHPELLKPDRASFRKAYDLYGIGCVLIEIGLWADLTTILLHRTRNRRLSTRSLPLRLPSSRLTYTGKAEMADLNRTKSELFSEEDKGSIIEALGFAAGTSFVNVVRLCLSAANGIQGTVSDMNEEEDEYDDHCIDLELEILEILKSNKL
jgi:hypothetical protein